MVKIECKVCGKQFMIYPCQVKKGTKKFCSWKCYQVSRGYKVKRKCFICGKDFLAKPSTIKKGFGRFCSRKCVLKFQRGNSIRICEKCGKEFKSCPSRLEKGWGKYCSKKCFGKAMRNKIERQCLVCEKKFWTIPSRIKDGKGKFCSDKCKRDYMVRENAPSWNGGTSKEPYAFEFNNQLKELIRHRDGYKCQKCGCPEIENNKKLVIHHIDYDKENCKPFNLISLCGSCNSKVNFNRSKWTKYFQKKVEKIMNSNAIQLNFRYKDNKTKQSIFN